MLHWRDNLPRSIGNYLSPGIENESRGQGRLSLCSQIVACVCACADLYSRVVIGNECAPWIGGRQQGLVDQNVICIYLAAAM